MTAPEQDSRAGCLAEALLLAAALLLLPLLSTLFERAPQAGATVLLLCYCGMYGGHFILLRVTGSGMAASARERLSSAAGCVLWLGLIAYAGVLLVAVQELSKAGGRGWLSGMRPDNPAHVISFLFVLLLLFGLPLTALLVRRGAGVQSTAAQATLLWVLRLLGLSLLNLMLLANQAWWELYLRDAVPAAADLRQRLSLAIVLLPVLLLLHAPPRLLLLSHNGAGRWALPGTVLLLLLFLWRLTA